MDELDEAAPTPLWVPQLVAVAGWVGDGDTAVPELFRDTVVAGSAPRPGSAPWRRELLSRDAAGPWQGPGRAAALPQLPRDHFPGGFYHTEKTGIQPVTGPRNPQRSLLGTGRAAWQQQAVPRRRDKCQPSPCGIHRTPSGPGVVGTPPRPRGTEPVCRAALAVPLICPNPVCTRGGAGPGWPQGDRNATSQGHAVAEAPQAHRDGLSPPGCHQDGTEPRAKHPVCARTGEPRPLGVRGGCGGPERHGTPGTLCRGGAGAPRPDPAGWAAPAPHGLGGAGYSGLARHSRGAAEPPR